jgi:hypothetical protein
LRKRLENLEKRLAEMEHRISKFQVNTPKEKINNDPNKQVSVEDLNKKLNPRFNENKEKM